MAAASGWGISAADQSPVLMNEAPASEDASPAPMNDARNFRWSNGPLKFGTWNSLATSDVALEPHNALAEASSSNEPCIMAPEEESLREDELPAEEVPSKKGTMGKGKADPWATLEVSQSEPIIEGFDSPKEHKLAQIDSIPNDLSDPYEIPSEPDIAQVHDVPAENAEPSVPLPRTARYDHHSACPWEPLSPTTSVLETTETKAPTEDGHTITLKILGGHKVLRAIVFVKACTRTAILNEARAYYLKWAQDDCNSGTQLPKECDLALMSLNMDGCDMDLSTYKVEDLSFLLGVVEKTGIPRFTLQISEM